MPIKKNINRNKPAANTFPPDDTTNKANEIFVITFLFIFYVFSKDVLHKCTLFMFWMYLNVLNAFSCWYLNLCYFSNVLYQIFRFWKVVIVFISTDMVLQRNVTLLLPVHLQMSSIHAINMYEIIMVCMHFLLTNFITINV